MPERIELLNHAPLIVEQAVNWGEMDSYAHVNNVMYFRYFENARMEYFLRIGLFEFERKTGIGPILAAVHARFRRPLKFPDVISISGKIVTMGEDRFTFEHRIVSHEHNAVTTEGESLIVTYDYREEKKTPIPPELRKAIEELEGKSFEP